MKSSLAARSKAWFVVLASFIVSGLIAWCRLSLVRRSIVDFSCSHAS